MEVVIPHGHGKGLRLEVGRGHPGYALGASEPLVQEALVRYLARGAVFYDIGANVGFLTMIGARKVQPEGVVYAFEPSPETAAVLRRNVARNRLENVVVIERAVAAEVGVATLAAEDPLTARLAPSGIQVETTTIDATGSDLRPPDVIKIDVEGAEAHVLRGMRATLVDARPIVICEIHGETDAECVELLEAAGYVASKLEPDEGGMPHIVAVPASECAAASGRIRRSTTPP
jgi:FkbM family methyltransferase